VSPEETVRDFRDSDADLEADPEADLEADLDETVGPLFDETFNAVPDTFSDQAQGSASGIFLEFFFTIFFADFFAVFSFTVLVDDFAIMEESFSKKEDKKPKVYGSIGKYSNETTIRDPDPRYLGIADFLGLDVAPRTVTVRQRGDFRQCAMTAGWLPVILSRCPIS